MSFKHDFCIWLGKTLYRFHLIDWDTYFNTMTAIVTDKYKYKTCVVDLDEE